MNVPTLNLHVEGDNPEQGVYAVRAYFVEQETNAVMHVGPRPTFGEEDVSIEVHLLNFEGEMPESEDPIDVEMLGFIRDVKEFESTEALKNQIQQDIMQATSFF
jgi:riboflavin kinase/FMN adenylyltransferase